MGLGVGSCARRFVVWDGVDWVAVTVEVVVMSAGVPGGAIELMNSVGESLVGDARRELRRRDTVLREDCGVLAGEDVDVAMLLVVVVVAPALIEPARRED